ncbi:unnamed protein product [Adineta steineri]|uniref:Uncharacterized protein n=1 Tax=Adineta steineri TaxID=433720 RepID=A0A815XKW7_9BILA|nr:unnamed protein product [Adineta steineri]CAF1558836.1 unnamed protein product [Adineta steineri]
MVDLGMCKEKAPYEEENSLSIVSVWWFSDEELRVLQILETFDISLRDLNGYFSYDDDLLNSLKFDDSTTDEQTDKPSLMNKIDPTYVSKNLWDKQILQTLGATEAVEKAANNDEYWKVRISYQTGLFVRITQDDDY